MTKSAIVKIRISHSDKARLERFAEEAGKSISEIVRSAIDETIRGRVAGHQRREAIAKLRRSTNQMLDAFTGKPIDIPRLREIATEVRRDAVRVLA
ncbi:ribbon-helix-helix protein, CopG family [Shinella sp.]|uniref:ribbon-helix-helix protein, CopG family n=1 Tax=Shinella sp. TaxID=1870904 RepID=UPI003D29BEFD